MASLGEVRQLVELGLGKAADAITALEAVDHRDQPLVIRTRQDVEELLDHVSTASATQAVPSMIEIRRADDPWAHQVLHAGIGADHGFVRVSGDPEYRTTVGDPTATGEVVFDYMDNATEVPAREIVPLSTVRNILTAFITHDGDIPAGFPELHTGSTPTTT
ncbi:Imm1 family immunity protein [Saccharothrix lopnurensis]|uniref:Imm1 family immunity protein n=1 Tax=Saccharothrix lopnurensis TaxID=1670621 RepID=A0ABW1PE46_9PSEU